MNSANLHTCEVRRESLDYNLTLVSLVFLLCGRMHSHLCCFGWTDKRLNAFEFWQPNGWLPWYGSSALTRILVTVTGAVGERHQRFRVRALLAHLRLVYLAFRTTDFIIHKNTHNFLSGYSTEFRRTIKMDRSRQPLQQPHRDLFLCKFFKTKHLDQNALKQTSCARFS